MTWIKRIALGLVGTFVGLILIILLWAGYDAAFGMKTSDYTNVTYTAPDGTELIGYLAVPEGEGPHPAVLLIHEWWGLNEGIVILADALAEEGYVVLAPDAYRGRVTDLFFRAIWLRLGTPQEQIFTDVDAALDYLTSLEEVDADRVASMGFCFGGGQSLQLGMRQSERISNTIIYYGTVVNDPEKLEALRASSPVLGVFGADDQSIPTAEVLEFEAALNTLDIPNEITIYEGVGHAFLTEENYNQDGTAGDAWQQTLTFLEENLK